MSSTGSDVGTVGEPVRRLMRDISVSDAMGLGINPAVLEEASGWDTWATSSHNNPGWGVSGVPGIHRTHRECLLFGPQIQREGRGAERLVTAGAGPLPW